MFRKNSMFVYLLVLSLCAAGGLQVWRTIFNNFAVDVAMLNGAQVGVIQSVREVPGFLALLVTYLLLIIREHRLGALAVAVTGAGLAATGFFPSYAGLITTTLIMSFGFHYFETVNQSLTLQHFTTEETPMVLALIRSRVSACNVVIGIFFLTAGPFLSYRTIGLTFGLIIIAAAILVSRNDPTAGLVTTPQRRKLIFRRQYWLFYLLTFLAGARRQIFMAFVLFLMVQHFKFTVAEIAALFLVNNAIGWILNPWIGRAVKHFGERWILSLEYGVLIFVFLGYGFTDSKVVVILLYVVDNMVYYFAMAIKTFFQKIADPRDIAPSMGMSFTVNHIAAVVIPAAGGMLWMVDYRLVFLSGALLALCSLAAVQIISRQLKAGPLTIDD